VIPLPTAERFSAMRGYGMGGDSCRFDLDPEGVRIWPMYE